MCGKIKGEIENHKCVVKIKGEINKKYVVKIKGEINYNNYKCVV